jgi:hypothetical protein
MRRYLTAALVAIFSLSFAACSQQGPSSGESSLIEIETSQLRVTVTNRAGMAITDVTVEVVPVGGATIYTSSIYRLENGSKQNFGINSFRGRDGTPLDLRVAKPKSVRVKCTTIDGNPLVVEERWR